MKGKEFRYVYEREILVYFVASVLPGGNLEDVTNIRNGERGTRNGEPGTGVWERVYSGNPPEKSKWRTTRRFQTLILSLGRVDN